MADPYNSAPATASSPRLDDTMVTTAPELAGYRVVRNLAETQRTSDRRRQAREQRIAAAEPYCPDPAARLIEDEAVAALRELDDPLREVLVARIWGQRDAVTPARNSTSKRLTSAGRSCWIQ